MIRQIHKHEADTSEAVARAFLAEQCPQSIGASLSWLDTSGTDNAMWRIHQESWPDLVLRLPRIASGARGVDTELGLLPQLAGRLPAKTPSVRHAGEPTQVFPHPWAVHEWLDGTDAWTARERIDQGNVALAVELANTVTT